MFFACFTNLPDSMVLETRSFKTSYGQEFNLQFNLHTQFSSKNTIFQSLFLTALAIKDKPETAIFR